MLVFALNGPPRSGKDTAGKLLSQMLGCKTLKFAAPLKLMAHAMMAVLRGDTNVAGVDAYEDCKDEPHDDFLGKTPREVYIAVSEQLCKPLWGEDFFGRLMRDRISKLVDAGERAVVITDAGFKEEIEFIANCYGTEVLQVFRPGSGFEGDSRGWVECENAGVRTVTNYGSIGRLRVEVAGVLEECGVNEW